MMVGVVFAADVTVTEYDAVAPGANLPPWVFEFVMSNTPTLMLRSPAAWPAATAMVPGVLNVVAGSPPLRGPTENSIGLDPVKEPPESVQVR